MEENGELGNAGNAPSQLTPLPLPGRSVPRSLGLTQPSRQYLGIPDNNVARGTITRTRRYSAHCPRVPQLPSPCSMAAETCCDPIPAVCDRQQAANQTACLHCPLLPPCPASQLPARLSSQTPLTVDSALAAQRHTLSQHWANPSHTHTEGELTELTARIL